MRAAFVRTITELAAQDPRIVLLTGDLGFMALEPFADQYPERFFNVGVAEQNMVGLATGLAEAGLIPFVYSIVTFATLRPYEFIRNGPVLHRLPVRIVGVGGGVEYGHAGLTHHGLEDVGVMRLQPGLTVIAPADYAQACSAIRATWDLAGPIYYRLGKNDKATVPGLDGRFDLSSVQIIREGRDLVLFALGGIAHEVSQAAELLSAEGLEATAVVVSSLNPAPVTDLVALLGLFSLAVTVEAHYMVGGLGSLIAETIADHGLSCRLVRCGVGRILDGISGSQDFLQREYGLSANSIVGTVLHTVEQTRRH